MALSALDGPTLVVEAFQQAAALDAGYAAHPFGDAARRFAGGARMLVEGADPLPLPAAAALPTTRTFVADSPAAGRGFFAPRHGDKRDKGDARCSLAQPGEQPEE